MSKKRRLAQYLLFFLVGPIGQAFAQAGSPLWQPAPPLASRGASKPAPGSWFALDAAQLAARLALAPPETQPTAAVTLELPYPDGTLHRFACTQVPVMAPELAARYPQIRTYSGRSLDAPATTVRLETSPAGFHAQVMAPTGEFSVLPAPGAANRYHSRPDASGGFECRAQPLPGQVQRPLGGTPPAPPAPYGSQLRTLRLAMAATGEYTQSLGGGSVVNTLASMVTLVSRLNAVYERDLAVRLQLVPNTDLLIYLTAATDPYNNSDPGALMETNRTSLTALLGSSTFDVGHVLGYRPNGYSGVAYVGSVCSANYKAGGASTGGSAGLMATVTTHEIGHQLGSDHTFNGTGGSCGGGNRGASLAFEPGAGNTLMSYDSRCEPDNVGAPVRYFHAGSLSAIIPELTCGSTAASGNQPPAVTVPPGTYTIPKGTPFSLTGSATDPNGDALTYSWEQLDLGDATGLAGAATDASGPPLFRSFDPSASGTRTFPALAAILSNTPSLGEILPLVARSLNFRLTVRDNRSGVAGANMALAVAEAGPFAVTSPAAAFTATPGSPYSVAWDVLGTDQPPVSCANVQILFSADGGQTFPTVLLASTPNDGSAQVTLPNLNTTRGRLKIQAVGNVFFAINAGTITLAGPLPVELATFTAEVRSATAHLAWTTATEKNNAGFAVEASADGIAFRRLGWVAGQGNSSAIRNYHFDDGTFATAYPGPAVYYRLRQIDQDGTESFSPVRTLARPAGLAAAAQLQVWPNPARGSVAIAGVPPGQTVDLLDLTGRLLIRATVPASGPLQLPLPGTLAPGVYVVRSGGQSRRLAVE